MIICHCAVVNCKTIAGAVESGSETLASLCSRTGAGQECGGCVFTVRRIMCDHLDKRAERLATTPAPPLEPLDATG